MNTPKTPEERKEAILANCHRVKMALDLFKGEAMTAGERVAFIHALICDCKWPYDHLFDSILRGIQPPKTRMFLITMEDTDTWEKETLCIEVPRTDSIEDDLYNAKSGIVQTHASKVFFKIVEFDPYTASETIHFDPTTK